MIYGGICEHYDCNFRNNAGYCQITVCMNPKYNGLDNKEVIASDRTYYKPADFKSAVEQYRINNKGYRGCENCLYRKQTEEQEPCKSCNGEIVTPVNWRGQTNADRIRAMSDEELAFYIVNHPMWTDADAYLKWLKQEAI